MIKEHDRNFWHVQQWRRDIDPMDARKFRDTDTVQCYDTATFNRIFRPEIYYSAKYAKAAEQGKIYRDHRAAALIFDYRVVHDPTIPTPEKIPEKSDSFTNVNDDLGGGHSNTPVGHDDLGGVKKPIKRKK